MRGTSEASPAGGKNGRRNAQMVDLDLSSPKLEHVSLNDSSTSMDEYGVQKMVADFERDLEVSEAFEEKRSREREGHGRNQQLLIHTHREFECGSCIGVGTSYESCALQNLPLSSAFVPSVSFSKALR